MKSMNEQNTFLTRSLLRWGGRSFSLLLACTLLVSLLPFFLGFYFIRLAAELDGNQSKIFQISLIGFLVLAYILVTVLSILLTKAIRRGLDHLRSAQTDNQDSITDYKIPARNEIETLPQRLFAATATITILFVAVLTSLTMVWYGWVDSFQVAVIFASTLASALYCTVLNQLLLDRIIRHLRIIFHLEDSEERIIPSRQILTTRFLLVMTLLFLASLFMVGMYGYQSLQHISQLDTNYSSAIAGFINNVLVLGIGTLALNLFITWLMIQPVTATLTDAIATIDQVDKGNLAVRASSLFSGESTLMTLQLNHLLDQYEHARINLDSQVEERTSDLGRKTAQFQALARISRETAETQDVNALLSRVVTLISKQFNYEHVGLFLADQNDEYMVLQATSSDGGKKLLAREYKVGIGQLDAVGLAASENRPQIIRDVVHDSSFQPNPDLPLTRSEAAIPLSVQARVIGVLDIQSFGSVSFSQDDVSILQTLADQVALSIQNARLLEESQTTLAQLRNTLSENILSAWGKRAGESGYSYRYTSTGVSRARQLDSDKTPQENDPNRIQVPITLRGQTLGNISLRRKEKSAWGETDYSLAAEVANQIGLAVENARLLLDAQQRAVFEQALSTLTSLLGQSIDSDLLLQTAARELHKLPNVEEVSVFIDPQENSIPGDTP